MRNTLAGILGLLLALATGGAAAQTTITLRSPAADAAKKMKTNKAAKPGNAGAAGATKPDLGDFDAFVAQAMEDWSVPGVAVAVVRDGTVILSKGYGLRDVKGNLPVTPQTLFAIGSITKSFTVTALGQLADEGKLEWDKPVREYLPGLRMYEDVVSARLTPRDMVTHRSGLPRHDALWYNSPFSRKEMVERLRYLEPNRDLRANYQYNNLMFMTAGYLAEQLSRSTWEALVERRIFQPLGMKSSNSAVAASQKSADYALPYKKVKEQVKLIPFRVIDEVGPAGSINSSIEDMTQYLRMHMNQGKHGEAQVLSAANTAQMQMPHMVIPSAMRWAELGHPAYGMAWTVGAYRGHKMVGHGGAIDGFTAQLAFLPEQKIGVVVLSNLNGQPLPSVLVYNAFDRLLGLEPARWSQRFLEDRKKGEASEEEAKKKGFTARREGTRPSHEIRDYAGEYEHAGYGVFAVRLESNELQAGFNGISAPLKHFHYDIFETPEDPENPLEKTKVSFFTTTSGDIGSLAILLEPNVKEIVFTRRPDRSMRERSFLEPLTGQYEVGPTMFSVTLRGADTLVIIFPGQPERELMPVRELTFAVQGLAGFSVEFKKGATGAVREIVFYQPNGTFAGKRK